MSIRDLAEQAGVPEEHLDRFTTKIQVEAFKACKNIEDALKFTNEFQVYPLVNYNMPVELALTIETEPQMITIMKQHLDNKHQEAERLEQLLDIARQEREMLKQSLERLSDLTADETQTFRDQIFQLVEGPRQSPLPIQEAPQDATAGECTTHEATH